MTPRRRRILQLVHDACALTGVSPTLEELAVQTGIKRSAVCRSVQALEKDGFIERVGGRWTHRGLQVVRMPGSELTAAEIAWCQANPERVRAMIKLLQAA